LASEFITELYYILSEEERLSPVECRAKIESDCNDIWSEDTIRKYLPPEAKDNTKRKAGKISAEIKKKVKGHQQQQTTMNQATKPLVIANRTQEIKGKSGQISTLIESDGSNNENNNNNTAHNDNSVGINPTENCPIRQKKQESGTFQQSAEVLIHDDDYFPVLLTDRLKDEAFEIMKEPLMVSDESMGKSILLLPSELAEQIYIEVNNSSLSSKIIPEFELEQNGTKIVSVRKLTQ
jgi:hypothetical protein